MEIYALLRTERELRKSEANFQSYYMTESARGQDEAGPVSWLVNRAGEMALYCRFRTPRVDPSRKILFGSSIDQAYSVKMAKNCRFFCVFIDLDFVLNIKMPIRLGHYPTIFTEQERLITHISWPKALVYEGSIIKDLLYSKNNFCHCWNTAQNPERARWAHVARSGSQ